MDVNEDWAAAGWDADSWDLFDAELVIETALDYMDEGGYF